MADRLWQALNERNSSSKSFSASLGAVLCLPRSCLFPATDLLDVADRAMYSAKSRGKNQITFVSLLSDADQRFLDAVQRRRFGSWLLDLGIGTPSQLGSDVRYGGSRFQSPGRLARRLGWLTDAELRPILREQRKAGRRFDEIAHERGLLTLEQVSALLALRIEPPEPLAANLVNQGILSEEDMRENLRTYYNWLRTG